MALLLMHLVDGPSSSESVHSTLEMGALMAVLMIPLAAPSAELVAERSLRHRRLMAVAEHLAGFGAVWFAVAIVATVVGRVGANALGAPLVFGALVGLAAVWQVSETRLRLMEQCGRVHVGPARGWRCDTHTFFGGAGRALRCTRTCWASMLAMAAATNLLLMLVIVTANYTEWAPGRNPFGRVRRRRPLFVYAGLTAASLIVFAV